MNSKDGKVAHLYNGIIFFLLIKYNYKALWGVTKSREKTCSKSEFAHKLLKAERGGSILMARF